MYSTNLYKMSFRISVGVNNHFQSTILGGVFMRDENAESFKWIFKECLTFVGGVHPHTILTGTSSQNTMKFGFNDFCC